MTKIQRPGFIISAVMFIIMGILFIFFDGWSGMVEFRFKTRKARQFQEALRSLTWSEPRA